MQRVFDPHEGSGSILVATITDESSARAAAARENNWREELAEMQREREIRSVMSQRHGVCG
jgi:hypothetical protein